GVRVADAAEHEALAVHGQVRAVEADDLGRYRRFGDGGGPRRAGRPRGLGRRRLHDGADFQLVDPDVGAAGAAVDVEHQAVDVSVLEIDRPLELGLHQLLLVAGVLERPAQLESLPAADLAVDVPADHRREPVLKVAGVGLAGQDHAGGQLHTGPVRLDPHARSQILADRGVGRGVVVVNVTALLG